MLSIRKDYKITIKQSIRISITLTYLLPSVVDISGAEIKHKVGFNQKRLRNKNTKSTIIWNSVVEISGADQTDSFYQSEKNYALKIKQKTIIVKTLVTFCSGDLWSWNKTHGCCQSENITT